MGCCGSAGGPDSALLGELLEGKTEEQKKVIKYFVKPEGCLSKNISDADYEQMVLRKRDSINFRSRAISKIGLDEDQVKEIPPAYFEGYNYGDAWAKRKANGSWVSSAYQVSWLFFSSEQIYFYEYTIHMDEDLKTERTDEYFYKDVTSFSTQSTTQEAKTRSEKGGQKKVQVETKMFKMVVPGEQFIVSMTGIKDADSTVQGMKHKLREKKGESK